MLLARLFSYRRRPPAPGSVSTYKQIPVNHPKVPVNSYSKDGAMRVENVLRSRVRAQLEGRPEGRPGALPLHGEVARRRRVHPRRVHPARRRRRLGASPATLVRDVMDDDQRDRLVSNVVGHLSDGVSEPVLERRVRVTGATIDKETGDLIAKGRQRGLSAPR